MCIASVAFVSSLVTKRGNTPTTLPNMLMSGSKLVTNLKKKKMAISTKPIGHYSKTMHMHFFI